MFIINFIKRRRRRKKKLLARESLFAFLSYRNAAGSCLPPPISVYSVLPCPAPLLPFPGLQRAMEGKGVSQHAGPQKFRPGQKGQGPFVGIWSGWQSQRDRKREQSYRRSDPTLALSPKMFTSCPWASTGCCWGTREIHLKGWAGPMRLLPS